MIQQDSAQQQEQVLYVNELGEYFYAPPGTEFVDNNGNVLQTDDMMQGQTHVVLEDQAQGHQTMLQPVCNEDGQLEYYVMNQGDMPEQKAMLAAAPTYVDEYGNEVLLQEDPNAAGMQVVYQHEQDVDIHQNQEQQF